MDHALPQNPARRQHHGRHDRPDRDSGPDAGPHAGPGGDPGGVVAVAHAALVLVLLILGVSAIPLTAWAVGPIYADFGVALPVVTNAILSVTPLGLVAIAGVLAVGAMAAQTLVRGRAAVVVFGSGALVAAAVGLLMLAMLLLPLVRMTESLSQ